MFHFSLRGAPLYGSHVLEGRREGVWELARPFAFLFFHFLEHFAHFHFRSHLQSLINGESHQIKLEQSQRCRPEANWRRRLSSPATSRSLRPHRRCRRRLCAYVLLQSSRKGKDPEASRGARFSASVRPFRCLPAAGRFAARLYACAHVRGDRRSPRCQPR